MQYKIVPYVGAGDLKFGMTISEVRNHMPSSPSPFRKSPADLLLVDAFRREGVHVYYKPPGLCEAIEFGPPALPMLNDHELLGISFTDAVRIVRALDPTVELDDSGLTSYVIGVAIYCPFYKETTNASVEGVMVFERDYYSDAR